MRSRSTWSIAFAVLAMSTVAGLWVAGRSTALAQAGEAKGAGRTVQPTGPATPGAPGAPGGAGRTDAEKLAYGAGFAIGEEVREGLDADGVRVDLAMVVRGFTDGLEQREPALDREELDMVLEAVHREMEARTIKRLLDESPEFRAVHDGNLERTKAFLAENGAKAGWVVLENGAQYKVVRAGNGASPTIESTVHVTYQAYRMDGSELDGARDKVVRVAKVLRGGREILPRMRVGDHWEVVLPPELAFGAAGDPPSIGPNEAIRFDVELLAVE